MSNQNERATGGRLSTAFFMIMIAVAGLFFSFHWLRVLRFDLAENPQLAAWLTPMIPNITIASWCLIPVALLMAGRAALMYKKLAESQLAQERREALKSRR